jgi:hypothetical protein
MNNPSDLVHDLKMGRPHVVILGAGASLAALPYGDRYGKKLPLMANFVEVLGLAPMLQDAGIIYGGENFEALYSSLATSNKSQEYLPRIEQAIFEYFAQLDLPDEPTLYDHLVLSLREKDLIATFNWDPFLVRALQRNGPHAPMPKAVFLHGSVVLGYCDSHQPMVIGNRGHTCGRCAEPLTDSKILYPVKQKNYSHDPFIKIMWNEVRRHLQHAYLLTIFGYGAPQSDVEATALMKEAWGDPQNRNLEEIEIIDITHEDTLIRTWDHFIHTHHYRTCSNFHESLIGKYPRRTCEAVWNGLMNVN